LGWRDIVLLRTYQSTLPDDELAGIPAETDIDRALAYKPTGAIVATPTALHLHVALPAANAGCHLFIEKPISHTLDDIDLFREAVRRRGVRVLVGFQFRFHPGLRTIKRLLDEGAIGAVVSANVHWGEYLPEWHPWEDYRQGYSGRADLGGGVVSTQSSETVLGSPQAPLYGNSRVPDHVMKRYFLSGFEGHKVTGPRGTMILFDKAVSSF